MFVSGVGGTGKSFLIAAIKALITDIWPTDDLTFAVAAPTGLAAFNVGGITTHRLFQLPVEHESKTAGYWSLPKPQKLVKASLSKVRKFIIDEMSMVSSLNLAYMHLRLDKETCSLLVIFSNYNLSMGRPFLKKLPKNLCPTN